jgi:hypothetical protein
MAPPDAMAYESPRQMLEYFQPAVLACFANCRWNIWQCVYRDTPPETADAAALNAFRHLQ